MYVQTQLVLESSKALISNDENADFLWQIEYQSIVIRSATEIIGGRRC